MPINFGELVEAQRKAVEARTRMAAKQRSRAAVQFIEGEEIALAEQEADVLVDPDLDQPTPIG